MSSGLEPLPAAPQWLAFLQAQNANAVSCVSNGRRQLKLSLASSFWQLPAAQRIALPVADLSQDDKLSIFSDPHDFADLTSSAVAKQKAIIVRTDFSNDTAWAKLRATIESDEKEGWEALSGNAEADEEDESDGSGSEDEGEEDGDGDGNDEPADAETTANTAANEQSSSSVDATAVLDTRVFIFVEDQAFNGASNLRVLRALHDVRITKSITRPFSYSGKAPAPNRLIARDGHREVYLGPQVWIQDAQSNADETLRVVLGAGAMYGTASGDSWRAKAERAWELQINMDAGMSIDFGGRDNWNPAERARNLAEAEA